MAKVAIIYYSKTGTTRQLGQAIGEGASKVPDTEIFSYGISGDEIVSGRFRSQSLFAKLNQMDAIVFGSPTYMGSVAAQFKAFADASSPSWSEQAWSGKLAAGFTCGTAVHGEQSSTLEYLMTLANQHGMFWVGLDWVSRFEEQDINPWGCSLGVVAHATENGVLQTDLATAQYLGWRVASTLARFERRAG